MVGDSSDSFTQFTFVHTVHGYPPPERRERERIAWPYPAQPPAAGRESLIPFLHPDRRAVAVVVGQLQERRLDLLGLLRRAVPERQGVGHLLAQERVVGVGALGQRRHHAQRRLLAQPGRRPPRPRRLLTGRVLGRLVEPGQHVGLAVLRQRREALEVV